jgi:hypothetical protein
VAGRTIEIAGPETGAGQSQAFFTNLYIQDDNPVSTPSAATWPTFDVLLNPVVRRAAEASVIASDIKRPQRALRSGSLRSPGLKEQVLADLVAPLSNPDFHALLYRLAPSDENQASARVTSTAGPAPDGRRRFGEVSWAIERVLKDFPPGLRVRDVRAQVQLLLGSPVASSSVKMCLHRGARQPDANFRRHASGLYGLAPR